MVIVASSGLRGEDSAWVATLRDLAPAGPKLAALAVERAASLDEDLLAVVVRRRV